MFSSEQACVNTTKYADGCTIDTSIRTGESSDLQSALDSVQSWAVENKMELNAKKTKNMWINFTEAPTPLPLHIGDAIIERVDNFKLLGTWFQKDLKWNKHGEETTRKAAKSLYCLRECKRANLPVEVDLTTYLTKIRPALNIVLQCGVVCSISKGRIGTCAKEESTNYWPPAWLPANSLREKN
ncbi:Hypothetical predicted protein [Paramuricea clavata]|uniref:Uncharacterized protein n=1 Tax=Paramuricea clavata TaxID=317549 RepID=A0A6S7HFZ5_PARCT|nr:Hypothetical predicted protein [Paramuricea clavata]